jgi:hypothetical protein
VAAPAVAQWTSYNTHRAISGIFGIAEKSIESAERKKEMEILARQKSEFQSDFQDAMQEAKAYEAKQDWESALDKYEEAATLNCKYEYSDIKGNKGGKLSLVSVENITMAPVETFIPWPYQKLRFALIFEPLPEEATEFDFIEPSSEWKYKDIKCR